MVDGQQDPKGTQTEDLGGGAQRVTLDGGTPAPEVKKDGDRPAWLPEKFKSPEDMAEAYKSLETKLSTQTAPEVKKPEGAPQVLTTDQATKVVQDAGLDINALSQEYAKTGELSKATYDSLTAKGIPQATVDAYIEGQKARVAQYSTKLAESVGGKDAMKGILDWASANLTPDEITETNVMLTSGNEAMATMVLGGLKARYTAAVGQDPKLVTGATGGRSGDVKPFESSAEVVKAMSDPRYQNDPAYRKKVADRLNVTNVER